MSNKSVYSDEISTDRNQTDQQQSLQYSNTNRSDLSAFGIPPGVSSYASANPMSAAAAAAFLIQAAAGGSANGDSNSSASFTRRRLSAANLFESPQRSPLSSSMISAAAQQAALAVAQAKGSPCSPSASQSAPSSFQAAVLSLALAASSSCTTTTSLSDLQFQDYHSFRGNSSVNDFIKLSEHPKLLSMHPLASALRRRSSTIAPCFVNVSNPECMDMLSSVEQKCASNPGFNPTSNLGTTNDQILNNQHLTQADFHESSNFDGTHTTSPCSYRPNVAPNLLNYGLHSEQRHQLNDPYDVDVDPNSSAKISRHYPMNLNSDKSNPNSSRIFSDALSQRVYEDPNVQSCYKTLTKLDPVLTNPSLLHSTIDPNSVKSNQQYFSTTPTPHTNEIPPNCSTSPLSCSSLSNSATPFLNISPLNIDCQRKNNVMDDVSGVTSRSSVSGRSMKTNCTMSDSKADEPSRKREQRLMKNREAARECRRKKKEYVKCLEARVSLLESQNQQLIEELQKVKALCFKELCNLGLTSSGAACAAAVLAAVTSGPSSTDTSGLNSTASFASDPDHCVHDQSGDLRRVNAEYRTTTSPLDDQSHTQRTRRRSFYSGTKLSPSTPQTQWMNPYPAKCSDVPTVTCGSSQLTHIPLAQVSNPCLTKLDESKVDNALTNCPMNPPSIDKNPSVPNLGDCMRGNVAETVSPNSESSQDMNRLPYRCAPTAVSSSTNWKPQQQSNPYQHPRYAAKRAYRNANFSTDAMPYSTDISQRPVESKKLTNTTTDANSVSSATMILAAAAAMAVKSESSTSESRLSV